MEIAQKTWHEMHNSFTKLSFAIHSGAKVAIKNVKSSYHASHAGHCRHEMYANFMYSPKDSYRIFNKSETQQV